MEDDMNIGVTVRPLQCCCYLLSSFCLAGMAQTWWLHSRLVRGLAIPLDGGATFRGKRWFGDNKTWRGLLLMPVAVGLSFLIVAYAPIVAGFSPQSPWPIPGFLLFFLGAWAGLAYMLAELPNSFLKRQLGIEAGERPNSRLEQRLCLFADQADSVIGALLAIVLFAPVPWSAWAVILTIGPLLHWAFNLVLKWTGLKKRAS